MRAPLEWLKEFVAIRLAPERLGERLTMAGLEVVAIHDHEGQPVFDLEVTPNRADCLSILGVAREIALATGQRLKIVQGSGFKVQGKIRKPPTPSPQPPAQLKIQIEDRAGCARYIGRVVEGVRVGPSPAWMQRRLAACGLRPINNVVDVTNYVLLEQGQPLHAFDRDRLAGDEVVVRRARAGEAMTTLDGVKRTLRPEMLVIADAAQAVAIAGIMGGLGSEVLPQTTRVLLESAEFDPVMVRRTARSLSLRSESSYRFERGVDPEGVERASQRAAALICELAGGTLRQTVSVGSAPPERATIRLELARAGRWLGVPLSPSSVRTTFARLGCRVAAASGSGAVSVTTPSFRRDLTQDVDLYEELARLHGYDRFPDATPRWSVPAGRAVADGSFQRAQALRRACAGLGLSEAVCWSLVSEAQLQRCGLAGSAAVRVENPISLEHAALRPMLLIGLLGVAQRNLAQGADGVRFFELGRVVDGRGEESLRLGLMLGGTWARDWRAKTPCDFLRLKGLLEALTEAPDAAPARLVQAPHPWADPTQSASVFLGEREIGAIGLVAAAVRAHWEIEHDVWFAELAADALIGPEPSPRPVQAPTPFPPVKRDLSVFVDAGTPCEALLRAMRDAGGPQTTRAQLIDRYTGPGTPAGRHGLTFSLEYRDPGRTLTAEEAGIIHARIAHALTDRFGATLR